MLFPRGLSFSTILIGSAAFFLATMVQLFVFHSVPRVGDWVQVIVVPLIAILFHYAIGRPFDAYMEDVAQRKSSAIVWLFILFWLLLFIPVCIIVFLGP